MSIYVRRFIVLLSVILNTATVLGGVAGNCTGKVCGDSCTVECNNNNTACATVLYFCQPDLSCNSLTPICQTNDNKNKMAESVHPIVWIVLIIGCVIGVGVGIYFACFDQETNIADKGIIVLKQSNIWYGYCIFHVGTFGANESKNFF